MKIISLKMIIELNGEVGIRTLERFRVSGFQDRCNRPLCHLSSATDDTSFSRVREGETFAVKKTSSLVIKVATKHESLVNVRTFA
jgi:hypothetical protein